MQEKLERYIIQLVCLLHILIISKKIFFFNMPLNFPSFCDHFVALKTAADYVYISESIENCHEMGKIFEAKTIG